MESITTVVTAPHSLYGGTWSSGICHCTKDLQDCCFGCWCCPCHACLTTKEYGECLCLPLLDMFGIIPPVTMSMRLAVRRRYGIQGSMCKDCVLATCCSSCVWCQLARELKSRQLPAMYSDLHKY